MRKTMLTLIYTVALLGLTGCATIPDKSELTQLDPSAIESEVVGNTLTYSADYGRWAEYYETATTGYGQASGSWGSESATSTNTITQDGEWCAVYSGEPDWADPDKEYCSVVYTDKEGNLYVESTKNPDDPGRVGKIRKVEIKPGDAYGLAAD